MAEGFLESNELRETAKDLFSSYANKPAEISSTQWLATELEDRVVDLGGDELREAADGISSSVNSFNNNLKSIEEAHAKGISNIQWLRQRLSKEDMAKVESATQALAAGNSDIYNALQSGELKFTDDVKVDLEETLKNSGYDDFVISHVMTELSAQADVAGAAGFAYDGNEIADEHIENPEKFHDEFLDSQTGSANDVTMKRIAAASMFIIGRAGKIPGVDKKTPIAFYSNVACLGVESAKTAKQVHDGTITVEEGLDRMAEVTCVVAAEAVTKHFPMLLSKIPKYGPQISVVVGPILSNMDPKIVNEVLYSGYKKIQPMAVSLVKSAIESAKNIKESVKSTVKNLFSLA